MLAESKSRLIDTALGRLLLKVKKFHRCHTGGEFAGPKNGLVNNALLDMQPGSYRIS
jgi:hypothetical protein